MRRFLGTYILFALPVFCSNAGSLNLNGIAGGGNYELPVTTFLERRFKTVYKQQYDFSCGSAALASLLTFHYEDIVSERDVFIDMYLNGNQEKIQKQGFSLLDIKRFLERRGYRSDGFKINLAQLVTADVPALTIINNNGYMHFVIIKGVTDQEILVGDPAVGVKAIPRDEFEAMWQNRILFLIYDKSDLAGKHFQDEDEWAFRVKAPLGAGVDRKSLSEFNLLQPYFKDF
ncbi:C39 family peptidase [Methylomicrobium sp. RS1]|jgi:predicted double-glycine peptidase|nr:C39 family peptidase [Methylomicrobium sp. RS1]